MSINFDTFLEWAEDRFGEENIKIRNTKHGVEICTHSYFALEKLGKDDTKYHLWMNTEGGKKKIEHGAYRCWLTDSMGTLVGLVSEFDGIPYDEAEELLEASVSLRTLEKQVHSFFESLVPTEIVVPEETKKSLIELPPHCSLIDSMPHYDYMAKRARNYLKSRKIPTEGLYICTKGDYYNRIIIPYYNEDGELVWYNGRTLSDKSSVLRYMKPDDVQEDIMYMTSWPKPRTKVYIMEGEFDAIALSICGFAACACGGKFLNPSQMEIFRERGWIPVLAFDNDPSGLEALIECGQELMSSGFYEIGYVRPPQGFKDWNLLYQKKGEQTTSWYVNKYEKQLNEFTLDQLMIGL